ncbi:MAG: ispD [Frankiales bacterium]|nr:ispD [Frankiales bacterium]
MTIGAIIVAAGSGERLGAGRSKALVDLHGRPIVDWSLSTFADHPGVEVIVVVAPSDAVDELTAGAAGRALVVPGGATRQDSVQAGLSALPAQVSHVLVHDAARPLVPPEVISSVIAALHAGLDAVIPVLPVIDTIKRVDANGVVQATVDRASLRTVQTPQGFRRDVLVAAHRCGHERERSTITDDAGLVEAIGRVVQTVPGSELAFKITTPHDLQLAYRLAGPWAYGAEPTQPRTGGLS